MKDRNGVETLIKKKPGEKFVIKGISDPTKQGEINESGVFTIEELEKDKEYKFAIVQEVDGKELIMGSITVTLDDDGEISVHEELIDPYGTITDKETGEIIGGAEVELRYADTERNRANGRRPGELVELPILDGFAPNDNRNTQISTEEAVWNDEAGGHGNYAWMVYPETDYYIVSKHPDYKDYMSPIISVEYEIVKHDFEMETLAKIPEEPTDSEDPVDPEEPTDSEDPVDPVEPEEPNEPEEEPKEPKEEQINPEVEPGDSEELTEAEVEPEEEFKGEEVMPTTPTKEDGKPSQTPATPSSPALPVATEEKDVAHSKPGSLPSTATNIFNFSFFGGILLLVGVAMYFARRKKV